MHWPWQKPKPESSTFSGEPVTEHEWSHRNPHHDVSFLWDTTEEEDR
jgi:hypothetical protein